MRGVWLNAFIEGIVSDSSQRISKIITADDDVDEKKDDNEQQW